MLHQSDSSDAAARQLDSCWSVDATPSPGGTTAHGAPASLSCNDLCMSMPASCPTNDGHVHTIPPDPAWGVVQIALWFHAYDAQLDITDGRTVDDHRGRELHRLRRIRARLRYPPPPHGPWGRRRSASV